MMAAIRLIVVALLLDGVASLSLGPAAAVRTSRRSFLAGGAAFAYSAAAIADDAETTEVAAAAEVAAEVAAPPSEKNEKKGGLPGQGMFKKEDGSAAFKLSEFKLSNPFDNDDEETKAAKKAEKERKAAANAFVKVPPPAGSVRKTIINSKHSCASLRLTSHLVTLRLSRHSGQTGIFGPQGLPRALDKLISGK